MGNTESLDYAFFKQIIKLSFCLSTVGKLTTVLQLSLISLSPFWHQWCFFPNLLQPIYDWDWQYSKRKPTSNYHMERLVHGINTLPCVPVQIPVMGNYLKNDASGYTLFPKDKSSLPLFQALYFGILPNSFPWNSTSKLTMSIFLLTSMATIQISSMNYMNMLSMP